MGEFGRQGVLRGEIRDWKLRAERLALWKVLLYACHIARCETKGRCDLKRMTLGGEELFRYTEVTSTEVYRLAAYFYRQTWDKHQGIRKDQ
jgi:hypothetical protein